MPFLPELASAALSHCALAVPATLTLGYLLYRWLSKPARVDFRGKVVWISGASSGIGEGLARAFCALGSQVILSARSVEKLEALRASCQSEFPQSPAPLVLPLDLAHSDDFEEKTKQVLSRFEKIDVLINNAGQGTRCSVVRSKMEVNRHLMEVNYFGHVVLTKAVLPSMYARRSGFVVTVSSVQGFVGIPYRSPFSAAKHALVGFFDSMASEAELNGVHVMLVCPGYVNTQHSVTALTADGGTYGKMDSTTAGGYSVEYIAERVIEGLQNREHSLILCNLKTWVGIISRILCTPLYYRTMHSMALKEADAGY